jgi:hypothetical protein
MDIGKQLKGKVMASESTIVCLPGFQAAAIVGTSRHLPWIVVFHIH